MFKDSLLSHYVTVALRIFRRDKAHTLIHLLGLALGLASCLMVLLFLRDELTYDRFHRDAARIYRVTAEVKVGESSQHGAVTAPPLAAALAAAWPELVAAGRLFPYFEGSLPGRVAVSWRGERQHYERFFWADPGLFAVLTFEWLAGEPAGQLAAPNTLVLSQSAARRYFGDAAAVGQVLRIDTGFSDEEYTVTGVVADLPANSHLHFDVLASLSSLEHVKDQRVALDQWWLADAYTYVKIAPGADAATLARRLPAFVEAHFPKVPGATMVLHLQPLTAIHLHSDLLLEHEVNGDIGYVYLFAAVAALTLLIAGVNFVNLSTARYAQRSREVAVRKVVGAHRGQLVQQFLGESVLLSLLAMALAVLLVWLALPAFNAFAGKAISLPVGWASALAVLGLAVAVGVLAGAYPAFFLSAFQPVEVLKSAPGVGRGTLRKVLVVLQFAIGVSLLVATGVVWDQLRFMRGQGLGLDLTDVFVLPIRDVALRERFEGLKAELAQVAGVESTTFSSLVIGRETPRIGAQIAGRQGFAPVDTLIVDQGFLDVFHLGLVAGRPLVAADQVDQGSAFLINERAVTAWGFGTPAAALGQDVAWGGWKKGKIVGVVKDFYQRPLRFPLNPLLLHIRPIAFHYMYLRLAPEGQAATLERLEAAWKQLSPGKPFEAFQLTDEWARLYRSEERLAALVAFFGAAAIFVACLGLSGLASYATERRAKEIGIRKALGSSLGRVVLLLTSEFTVLVLLAILVAWPCAYWLLHAWLGNFAFRTPLRAWSFLAGGSLALLIAWLTVGARALKGALADPAGVLRGE